VRYAEHKGRFVIGTGTLLPGSTCRGALFDSQTSGVRCTSRSLWLPGTRFAEESNPVLSIHCRDEVLTMREITEVSVLDGFTVHLVFDDGSARTVDLEPPELSISSRSCEARSSPP